MYELDSLAADGSLRSKPNINTVVSLYQRILCHGIPVAPKSIAKIRKSNV